MFSRRTPYLIPLILVMILFVFLNIYLIRILYFDLNNKSPKAKKDPDIIAEITNGVRYLKSTYKEQHNNFEKITDELVNLLKPNKLYENNLVLANITKGWPSGNELYPRNNSLVGSVLQALATSQIKLSELAPKGTQLKLLLNLEGGLRAIFKPRWYERSLVVEGPVYAGKDRDNAEVLAFYLAAMLDLRSAPVAAGRKIPSKEFIATQSSGLRKTTFYNEHSQYCFYGKCRYCTSKEPICEDDFGNIDGVMILYLDLDERGGMLLRRSPWQRTYKSSVQARWETDLNYCESVKEYLPQKRILDLIDMSIVDFLLQNGDRHHYETFEGRTILLDNGKGLGNPNIDHIDILAPFYQCCMIRQNMWDRLLLFKGDGLSLALKKLISKEPVQPVVTKEHLKALDRRLKLIYSTYEFCKNHVKESILK